MTAWLAALRDRLKSWLAPPPATRPSDETAAVVDALQKQARQSWRRASAQRLARLQEREPEWDELFGRE
jgi:hypothetical protein